MDNVEKSFDFKWIKCRITIVENGAVMKDDNNLECIIEGE